MRPRPLVLVLALAWAPALAAQSAQPAQAPLSLAEAVRSAVAGNPGVRLGERRLQAAEGERLAASAPFAPVVESSVGSAWDREPEMGQDGTIGTRPRINSGTYALSLAQRFRAGVVLQPQVEITRTDVDLAGSPVTSSASASLGVLVPLLKDRGGSLARAPERAAQGAYRAQALELRQTVAGVVAEAAAAYWQYRAAAQRAEVLRLSEARARKLADETQQLVQADERPAADLNQLRANVASKRMSVLAGEQAVVDARRRLGLAMGTEAGEVSRLGPAADPFPAPARAAADATATPALVARALAARPDLAAERERESAARVLVDAASSDLRPTLDLSVSVGYRGLATGAGVDGFVAPLYRDVPGASTTVGLQYRVPVSNAEARGRAMQRLAALEQQRIAGADLARRIATGVEVAAGALQSAVLTIEQADAAVELYRAAVENERTKHQLGAATLFDVILAEDALTGAMLGQVDAHLAYALAVVSLRLETGTLLADDGATVEPARLLSPP